MANDFKGNLTDIWYGNEIEVSIGYWDSSLSTPSWVYEVIEYREDFTPDTPDNKEGVNDGLEYRGDKRIYVENTIELSQKFRGFGKGLDKFQNYRGLVLRARIVPDGGTIPADSEEAAYYTNLTTSNSSLQSIPNTGAFNNNLTARFNDVVYKEPEGSENWVEDQSTTLGGA